MEAIKILAGFGEPLAGILLSCDLRTMSFSRRQIQRNPACAVCGHRS
jgi:molybdopterin-synthase adenylyltransferase